MWPLQKISTNCIHSNLYQTKNIVPRNNVKNLILMLVVKVKDCIERNDIAMYLHTLGEVKKGAGNQQALLVWTSSGMDLDKVISVL
jgi:hypothetical protein